MPFQRIERGIRLYSDSAHNKTYHVEVKFRGRRATSTTKTLTEARKIRSRLHTYLLESVFAPDKDMLNRIPWVEFADRYVELHLRTRASRSWKHELPRVRMLVEAFRDLFVDEITPRDIEQYLSRLHARGARPATLNRHRARLNSMMKRAVAWNHRMDNPVEKVDRMKEEDLGDRYLLRHEYEALLDVCEPDLKVMVVLAVHTGARQGELLALRWTDVDMDSAFLTIRSETAKTYESRRIPLNSEAIAALESLGPRRTGFILPFRRFPRKRWKNVVKRMGWDKSGVPRLRGWRFHDLRHCCASWLVQQDVPLSKVAKILGHRTLAMVQRYAHLSDDSLVVALDKIARQPIPRPYRAERSISKSG